MLQIQVGTGVAENFAPNSETCIFQFQEYCVFSGDTDITGPLPPAPGSCARHSTWSFTGVDTEVQDVKSLP